MKEIAFGLALITAAGVVFAAVLYILFHRPVKGSRNLRSHYTKAGKPKVAYRFAIRANFQTIKELVTHLEWMPAYKCPLCKSYHLGHKR